MGPAVQRREESGRFRYKPADRFTTGSVSTLQTQIKVFMIAPFFCTNVRDKASTSVSQQKLHMRAAIRNLEFSPAGNFDASLR